MAGWNTARAVRSGSMIYILIASTRLGFELHFFCRIRNSPFLASECQTRSSTCISHAI